MYTFLNWKRKQTCQTKMHWNYLTSCWKRHTQPCKRAHQTNKQVHGAFISVKWNCIKTALRSHCKQLQYWDLICWFPPPFFFRKETNKWEERCKSNILSMFMTRIEAWSVVGKKQGCWILKISQQRLPDIAIILQVIYIAFPYMPLF